MTQLYFRQLLAGRDIARDDPIARQMVNFVYLIGDKETGEAVAVDPAYAPAEIIEILQADGMTLSGVLATHYHADHVGGSLFGHEIAGVADLLEQTSVPIHVQDAEAPWVLRSAGISEADLVRHKPGEALEVGGVTIDLVHTPGHTPGSQCFLVDGRLVAGDTLFLNGCGRTDLPGSNAEQMYDSLFNTLLKMPGNTVVYPGHLYSEEPSASLDETRRWNPVLAPRSADQWLAIFGN